MKRNLIQSLVLALLITGCAPNNSNTSKQNIDNRQYINTAYDEEYPVTEEDIDEEAPYRTEDYLKYYSEYYKNQSALPPFDLNMDLSNKSFTELRNLRAEIFARHGYLFMDYVLRSEFNATKWYRPVFWYEDYKIKLNEEEKTFLARALSREKELYKTNYISSKGLTKANIENVVNWKQFDNISPVMKEHLTNDGFVINKANYEQLFHVYDENYYDYTPSFITTDLFLQVLHMHISKEMQAIEEQKMIPLLTDLLTEQYNAAKNDAKIIRNQDIKKSAEWNQVYYAIGVSLLTGDVVEVPAEYNEEFNYEYNHALEGMGFKSDFLGDSLMDYTQFQPRGNYTRTDSLQRYFKCMKWLNSASVYIDTDKGLKSAVLMANAMKIAEKSFKNYEVFSTIIGFLAGEENNLSLAHLIKVLDEIDVNTTEELLSAENLDMIRAEMYRADPRKMFPKGANERTEDFLARKKMLFTAGRYTFDADILQRLIHITRPEPKRPFPKGLDVFAAMGNKTAEGILLNQYKEQLKWEDYPDSLNFLKNKFKGFDKWDQSLYNKTMETVLSLQDHNPKAPYYMNLPNWQKKNLNTMLASWTGLKHDMILYIEQPSGAEMGDGGEIPPPQKIAYVEPQTVFWQKCIDLLNLNNDVLNSNNLQTENLVYRNKELSSIANLFLRMSQKELNGERLSNSEFDSLSFIGGQIESLTLNIIESPLGYMSEVTTPDKYVAIATDVYTYNDKCLQECNGMADEIYVIAEINGLLYLTRGAVFSQYEFVNTTAPRLTDEAWQQQLSDHKEPPQARWMDDIKIHERHLETAPNFNLY